MAVPLLNAGLGTPQAASATPANAPTPVPIAPGRGVVSALPVPGASPINSIPNVGPPSNVEAIIRSELARHVRNSFADSKQQRERDRIDDRMIAALRAMRGEYPPDVLADIQKYGGSTVFARLTSSKVRAVSAMLREIYTADERPWALSPTPDPELSGPSLQMALREVMKAEIREVIANGEQATDEMITNRMKELRGQLLDMRRKVAKAGLEVRENGIDDILTEGGFYKALYEVLQDIATFPFGCIKGPVVERERKVTWKGTKPTVVDKPVMKWMRVSPFDLYFAPWAQAPQDGYIIQRVRTTRQSLLALKGLPSYDSAAIDRVLDHGKGYNSDWLSYTESDRAWLEQRDSDSCWGGSQRTDRPMPMLEYHGSISGKMLKDWGMPGVDASHDIDVVVYLIADEVIGVRKNPHPAGFKPFYVTSFENVPGSIYGNGVPDLINDIQGVGNAVLRALVNNMAMASGPMVYFDEDRVGENDPDPDKLWPWKIFRGHANALSRSTTNDPPIQFFQPKSNAQELLGVYRAMAEMADDLSSLPKSMQGSMDNMGGTGRSAAGLSMMLNAGSRTVKQAVTAIDNTMVEPVIEHLNIYLSILKPDMVLEGDITVVARGAAELAQQETLRMRKLEFLQITNNPVDLQLVGPMGRWNLLKDVAKNLGMPVTDVLPNKPPEQFPMPPGPGGPGGSAPGGTPTGGPPQAGGSQPGDGAPPQAAPQREPANPTAGVARGPAV